MKKRKTLFSKTDIENLISDLRKLYPKLRIEKISNWNQAKEYFLQLDLLVRSSLFKNTLLDLSDLIINLSRKVESPLLSDLKSQNSHLREVFHELFIGNYFKKNGYDIIYQPEFVLDKKPKTPDWLIKKNDKKAIIEVFTLNNYEDYINEKSFSLLLNLKLKKIENEYNVKFDFIWSSFNIKRINERNINDYINMILADVELWLKHNSNPKKNNHHETLFGIEIIALHNSNELRLGIKTLKGAAHSYRPSEKINEKYEYYKEMIRKNKLPFIIACITDNLYRLNIGSFQNIIFGINQSSSSINNDGVVNQQKKLYEVSGFILFGLNSFTNQLDYEYIQNPNAKYPMELIIKKV